MPRSASPSPGRWLGLAEPDAAPSDVEHPDTVDIRAHDVVAHRRPSNPVDGQRGRHRQIGSRRRIILQVRNHGESARQQIIAVDLARASPLATARDRLVREVLSDKRHTPLDPIAKPNLIDEASAATADVASVVPTTTRTRKVEHADSGVRIHGGSPRTAVALPRSLGLDGDSWRYDVRDPHRRQQHEGLRQARADQLKGSLHVASTRFIRRGFEGGRLYVEKSGRQVQVAANSGAENAISWSAATAKLLTCGRRRAARLPIPPFASHGCTCHPTTARPRR